ncbi:hypothetical protein Mycsm_06588 (plasmid) [Mycobacterium sp. JS623]|uniref:hypothetical protein n=1 Tax=Mycobacterium sp. JS623 TaxID=212767 RepID=UPI0002A58758|nr:hypothetical protein [Mycobacterium sp. JS623]AGB26724.1 hypothetical protein Mycsm_06588 [Mycobacterium sp. JS623]
MTSTERGDITPPGRSHGEPSPTPLTGNGSGLAPQPVAPPAGPSDAAPATVALDPGLGRFSASWREHLYSRVVDLSVAVDCLANGSPPPCEVREIACAQRRLAVAAAAIERTPTPWSAWTGADVERAWVNAHAVEVTLIRLGPPGSVAAKLPGLIAGARQVLPPNDPRLQRLSAFADGQAVDVAARGAIAEVASAVHAATASEHMRARSFRNILLAATMVLTLLAVGLAVLGSSQPTAINLCAPRDVSASSAAAPKPLPTCPSGTATPSGLDIQLVELIGLFSAALIGSVAIRKMRGTSTPYAVPMASLAVKLPTGALTAVGGLLLIRAGVLGPAVAASATAQILAYALLFGASQQTFTRLIDRQAQTVLDSLPSRDRAAATEHQDAAAP